MAPARQGDQVAGCTLSQAHDAVSELAKLHGPRWNDPSLYEIDWIERDKGEESANGLAVMWQMFFPGFAGTYRSHLSADEFELAERFGGLVARWRSGRSGPKSITHGDYRLDNMLFATPEGGPEVTVVDWQTPAHGDPIADLSYFIGAGLLPEVRRPIEQDLVRDYHQALKAAGISDYSWEQCWEDYRRATFAGFSVTVVATMLVQQTKRGDEMFTVMAQRHSRHALDLKADELL